MVKFFHALLVLFFVFSLHAASTFAPTQGYNNTDPVTNGEHWFLKTYLKNPTILFDVGANVGEWSLFARKLAPAAKIYAFEPHPDVFLRLQKTLSEQMCINMAVGDAITEGELYVWGSSNDIQKTGLSSLHYRPILKDLLVNSKCSNIKIKTTTIDDFCFQNKIGHIDFLKIDTEGNEWHVLLGSKNMLFSQAIKMIQFEYGGTYLDSKTTLKDVFYLLKNAGYIIYRISPSKLLKIDQWSDELENYQYSNYAALLD